MKFEDRIPNTIKTEAALEACNKYDYRLKITEPFE
jgi:hypothetical protein